MEIKNKNMIAEISEATQSGDIIKYMSDPAIAITDRVTPMIIGLYADAETKTVNTWLHNMHEEKLSPRNPYEAMFMYVYGKYKKEERLIKWFELYNKYNPVIEKHMSERKGTEIVTYGNLCDLLKKASDEGTDKTFATKNYTQNTIVPELDKAIESDSEDAFGEYLNFLFTSEEIGNYDRKATYYLRKLVYEVLTDGLYMLFDRHGYEYRKDKNESIRKYALSNEDSFNRFISDFNICLDEIKECSSLSEKCKKTEIYDRMKCTDCVEKCRYNENLKQKSLRRYIRNELKQNFTEENYKKCKEWLFDREIDFWAFTSAFFEFYENANNQSTETLILGKYLIYQGNGQYDRSGNFTKEDFQSIRVALLDEKNVKLSDKSEFNPQKELLSWEEYKAEEKKKSTAFYRNEDFYIQIYKTKMQARNKREIDKFLNMLCDKKNTSRRMLILFGFFAQHSKGEIDVILDNCGFEVLNDTNKFDKEIIKFIEDLGKIGSLDNEHMRYYKDNLSKDYVLEKEEVELFNENWEFAKNDRRAAAIDFLNIIEIDEELPKVVELFNTAKMVNIIKKESQQLKTVAKTLKKEKK